MRGGGIHQGPHHRVAARSVVVRAVAASMPVGGCGFCDYAQNDGNTRGMTGVSVI